MSAIRSIWPAHLRVQVRRWRTPERVFPNDPSTQWPYIALKTCTAMSIIANSAQLFGKWTPRVHFKPCGQCIVISYFGEYV